jgi:hypothetical protein
MDCWSRIFWNSVPIMKTATITALTISIWLIGSKGGPSDDECIN